MTTSIAVLGAGAWGTALAAHLARRSDIRVTLWARDGAQAALLDTARANARYLPGFDLPAALAVTAAIGAAADAELLVAATPIAGLQDVVHRLAAAGATSPLVWLSKGILAVPVSAEFPAGAALAHQVIAPRWPAPVGVISGPSFAE